MKTDDDKEILTLTEVAQRLRHSKAHAARLLNGEVQGLPPLTHFAMGPRIVVTREWLETSVAATLRRKHGFGCARTGQEPDHHVATGESCCSKPF